MPTSVTIRELIAELQKLPPDAEVVTSIYGWEGLNLGPVTIVEPIKVVGYGRHIRPTTHSATKGRIVYLLDTPAWSAGRGK